MPRKSNRIQARKIKEQIVGPDLENVLQPQVNNKKRKADDRDVEPLQDIHLGRGGDGSKKRRLEKAAETTSLKNTDTSSLESYKIASQSPYCNRDRDRLLFNNLPDCRLPKIRWLDEKTLWQNMFVDCISSKCHPTLFNYKQTIIKPTMRTILIDWMMEVCSAYCLQRETFCLSVQFTDRYLNVVENIGKNQLQLIGVTSLFIASKLEEIYPPRLADFAEMTDGACTVENITEFEILLLNVLQWNLVSMTANAWLAVYMQIINCDVNDDDDDMHKEEDCDDNFILPQFHFRTFQEVSILLDFAYLDYQASLFPPAVLAAAAMNLELSPDIAKDVSGLKPTQIEDCLNWLKPIYEIKKKHQENIETTLRGRHINDFHNIQSHVVSLEINNEIQNLRKADKEKTPRLTALKSNSSSPAFLTPPPSNSKRTTNCSKSNIKSLPQHMKS